MKYFEMYRPEKSYFSPVGERQDREWIAEKRPAMLEIPYIVEVDSTGEVMLGYWPAGHLRGLHGIAPELSDAEALAAIGAIENAPPEAPLPDATERLAAAQEYSNMMQYEDVAIGVLALNAERGLWSPAMAQTGIATIAATLSDDDALALQPLVKEWSEVVAAGGTLKANEPFSHGGQLYRAVQDTTPQAHQEPGATGMLAVYRPVEESHAGTLEDPVPFRTGLACEKDKYYTEAGVLYKCTRDYDGSTGHSPAQLVGHYFMIWE
ncbi:hypothetical protein LJC60_10520 [Ruminococcaceae bacterium OttesenSCG-928-D13]|nr:hypothetical protein [Ruminococcaceae bacterium OttesenSCG-928-D13]